MRKNTAIAVLGVAMLLATAGCGSEEHVETTQQSRAAETTDSAVSAQNLTINDIEPKNFDSVGFGDKDWAITVNDSVIVYEAAGSGTCKPIIETALLSGNTLTLKRYEYAGRPCTMDLRHFAQEIHAPEGTTFPEDLQVEVINPDLEQLLDNNDLAVTGEYVLTDSTGDIDTDFAGAEYLITIQNGAITYEAGGSGGCPPVIDSVETLNGEIVLTQKDWGTAACAESYVVVKQIVERADGNAIPTDAVVTVNKP